MTDKSKSQRSFKSLTTNRVRLRWQFVKHINSHIKPVFTFINLRIVHN